MPSFLDYGRCALLAAVLTTAVGCGNDDKPKTAPAATPSPTAIAAEMRLFPPGALTAEVTARGEVELRWIDTNEKEDGYLLERRLPDAFAWAPAAQLPADSSSTTDADVIPSKTYFYRVVAHSQGVTSPSPALRVTVRDLIPPATEIIFRPPPITSQRVATFVFRASEGAATFVCRLDDRGVPCQTGLECYAGESTCQGRFTAGGLSEGEHVFEVYAVDLAGNADATPVSVRWSVDNTPPKITLGTRPADPTASSTANFSFAVDETRATVTCQLNNAPPVRCLNSFVADLGLVSGEQSFRIEAVDLIGNASTVVYTWRRDTSPPAISYRTFEGVDVSAPNALRVQSRTSVTIGFTATDEIANNIASLQCRLTTPSWQSDFRDCDLGGQNVNCGSSCTTTLEVPADGDGLYALEISTVDNLGNRTIPLVPQTHKLSWTFDDKPPIVTLVEAPSTSTATSYLRWRYEADEPVTGYSCVVDGTPRPCSNPFDLKGADENAHSFTVTAWDRAGNGGVTGSTTIVAYPDWSTDAALAGGDFLQILSGDFTDNCAYGPIYQLVYGSCPDFTAWSARHFDSFGGSTPGTLRVAGRLGGAGTAWPVGPNLPESPISTLPLARPWSGAFDSIAHRAWIASAGGDTLRYEVGLSAADDKIDLIPRIADRIDFAWEGIDHLLLRHAHPPRGMLVTPDEPWLIRVLADARAVDNEPSQSMLQLSAVAPEGDTLRSASYAWNTLFYSSHDSAVVDLPMQPPYCAGWFELQAMILPEFTSPSAATDNASSRLRIPVLASISGDDPGEPNNAQGAETDLGAAPIVETNRVLVDEDWYRVVVPSAGTWQVAAIVPGGYGQQVAVGVYPAGNGTPLGTATGTDQAALSVVAAAPGEAWDIRVYSGAYPACRRYRLEVTVP